MTGRGLVLLWIFFLFLLLALAGHGQDGPAIGTLNSSTTLEADKSASTAAMLASTVCMKGISGQIVEGGFSITNADGFCDLVRLSDVMLAASNTHRILGNNAYADLYMEYHHNALEEANSLISKTSFTTYLDRLFGGLVLPILLFAGLALL